ncbi:enoyl-CoA hydratase/isomerase family protein [Pseudonocardia sp. NPDC049154]|uniref:enoyl-CoA hydratase/isomerase family protein n=1 Tax=Pseudonocardia sp. NPDC049154 TaxID=3155501 RepID=UPI0033D4E328
MTIGFELSDGVALVTLDRPEKLNALDAAAYAELSVVWQRVRDDPAVRVAVLTGAGERSFCVGADLHDPGTAGGGLGEAMLTQRGQLLNRGLEVWKPVLAAVNGYCLGGGMTLLLATDLRYACPEATFALPEVTRGLLPGNGGTQRAAESLSHCRAMELLLTGERIDAATAQEWGLVNAVVPRERLLDEVRRKAEVIAANAPLAVQATKELAVRSRSLDLAQGLRAEAVMLALLQTSEDAREGRAAFAERRPPRFTGA